MQLEAEGRVGGLVTVVAALVLGGRTRRHAQGVRAKAVKVGLQGQVGARGGQSLLMLAAVPSRGEEGGW